MSLLGRGVGEDQRVERWVERVVLPEPIIPVIPITQTEGGEAGGMEGDDVEKRVERGREGGEIKGRRGGSLFMYDDITVMYDRAYIKYAILLYFIQERFTGRIL